MSVQYRKIYTKNGFVAYGRVGAFLDHLFLWEAATGPDLFNSLSDLLTVWSRARRTVLFCPTFDPATIVTALDSLAAPPGLPTYYGKFWYWRESHFTGRSPADSFFPTGRAVAVLIGDISLGLDVGTPPVSLDDFTSSADSSGNNLMLALTASPNARWTIDNASAGNQLLVSLDNSSGFVAGSIGLSVPWPAGSARHPLNRAGLVFIGGPPTPPTPGGDPVPCRVWTSRLSDKVISSTGTGATCGVLLDPRDGISTPDWLAGEMNSRLLFGDAEIYSSFFSSKGDRFSLKSAGGSSRLGFVYDRMLEGQSLITSGTQTIFHPEGDFEIKSPTPDADTSALNVSARDFVAGAATTEFFDLNTATHIRFVKRQPAFFLEGESGSPASRKLLDDRGGVAITSHVQFLAATGAPPATVPFHSQPAEAALFVSETAEHLRRRRVPFGSLSAAVPVFPRAGYQASDHDADSGIRGLDATHLCQYRRNKCVPFQTRSRTPQVVPTGRFGATTVPATSLAVTPQGILAEINLNGSYSRLYFGNPDSHTARLDFSIGITNSDPALYGEIQQALAGNQLFMVFNSPTTQTLNSIAPSATLYVRDFQFSVGPTGLGQTARETNNDSRMGASVVIIKFVTGKTLDSLIQDTTYWACQSALAPNGNAGIKKLTGLDEPVPLGQPDYLKTLRDLWFNPNWQGILVLDLPIPVMPDILEALRPGLSPEVPLRAHHFGLNVVPVHRSDLVGGTDPKRPGSAFGLIQYAKGNKKDPPNPTKADKEPGAAVDPDRNYRFIVDSLRIGFENSQISTFQAKVFVKFDHLFWDKVTPDDGVLKSLELDGFYESRTLPDGTKQDVFSLISPQQMSVDFPVPSYLKTLTITRAQLSVTSLDRDQRTKSVQKLTVEIDIDGTLTLNEKLTHLPLFTVKSIRLSSFGFQFVYDYGTRNLSFGFIARRISADIDFNPGDAASLLSFLPVKLKGMSVALTNLLDLGDLNFFPINFGGLDPGGAIGTKFHFGFLMDLDLGSIGKLAGDLSGLHIPLLIGWKAGSNPGFAFGIQFPTFNGKIDIGIQQFIRLRADKLNIKRCLDASNNLTAVAIQAVHAQVVFLGRPWPVESDIAFIIFIPAASARKPSWALGFETGDHTWYVGGGYRITLDGTAAKDTKGIVKAFRDNLSGIGEATDVCALLGRANPDSDNWSIAAQYKGGFTVGVAISDPGIYGLDLDIADFDLDLLYRRVNGGLGIFSIEFCLPGGMRTMQFGAATIRLPVFRLEVHTDGGFLADFGFPWNNDFSRSAQVEIAIFLGSGGFYFGITAASASDLLNFQGGYSYSAPDPKLLNAIRTLRLGFAARVGIGRSFTIGILRAEASLTIFGGLEGAAGYRAGENNLFNPTVWALRGYVGLMLDISATVSFAIIQASARILAYADVGLDIRRVLAKRGSVHYLVTLPLVIFADIGLTVAVDVGIHVGCVSITIHLSFSATWHFEQALTSLSVSGPYVVDALEARDIDLLQEAQPSNFALSDGPFAWTLGYAYWNNPRPLNIYATVLPCMGQASDFGQAGGAKTCVVGTMLLQVLPVDNAFGDLAKFLTGWILLPAPTGNPGDYADQPITLGTVSDLQTRMDQDPDLFWNGFADAVLAVVKKQFAPALKTLLQNQDEPFAVIPPWPSTSFSYFPPTGSPVTGIPSTVMEQGKPMAGDNAAFAEYCRHLIVGTVSEIGLLIQNTPGESRNDRSKSMKWSDIWTQMFGQP